MNFEKFLELILNAPENISIQYSNINGNEKLLINGEEVADDEQIKEEIAIYKDKIAKLDDHTFELVMEQAEKECFNLSEMSKGLELDSYNEDDELYARNVISMMSELVRKVITREINNLTNTLNQW